MRMSPALVDLMVELSALAAADRRAILAGLEPGERQQVEHHLQKVSKAAEPSFDALAMLSPWLAESLAEARSGKGERLTPAVREALIEAERLLPRDKPAKNHSPSLLERLFKRGRDG